MAPLVDASAAATAAEGAAPSPAVVAPAPEPVATCHGYCRDQADHAGVKHGYGPRLTPTAAGTWRRENPSLADAVAGPPTEDGLVTVDIVETVFSSATSSAAGPGEYAVNTMTEGPSWVILSPARNAAERAAGVLAVLPRDLYAPLRITATLTRNDGRPLVLVRSIARLAFPAPAPLPSLDALVGADADDWDRRYVVTTGPFTSGPETSRIGRQTELRWMAHGTTRCYPRTKNGEVAMDGNGELVRVTGVTHTKKRHYGHEGMAKAQIDATDVMKIDPSRPGCRPVEDAGR